MNVAIKKQQSAFTLIELLVVISIIALLLSIIMPALQSAREQARTVVCLSQQRSLGTALHTYSTSTGYLPVFGEFRGYGTALAYASNDPLIGSSSGTFPPVTNWKDGNCFGTPLACLIKNGDLQDPKGYIQACPTSSKHIKISFGYNYANLGSSSRPEQGAPQAGNPNFYPGCERIKLTSVQRPSETAAFCDGSLWGPNLKDPKPWIGSYGMTYWDKRIWPDVEVYGAGLFPVLGHRNSRANVTFVDGYASSVFFKELHADFSTATYAQTYEVRIWKREKTKSALK